MNRFSRSFVAVCAVASLLVAGAGVSPVSAKTINGCVIKAKTKCVNANLKGADLTGANLTGVNLTGASLYNAILVDANLTNANLDGANLDGVQSWGTDGTPILPSGWTSVLGYLVGPNANLVNATLTGADLTNVNLSGADLTGANVVGVDFTNVNFANANLTLANFNDTTLDGVTSGGVIFNEDPTQEGGNMTVYGGYVFGKE